MMIEKDAWHINGYVGMAILIVLALVAGLSFYETEYWLGAIFTIVGVILSTGMTFVQPNQAIIIQFLGRYAGTYRNAGVVMLLPFSIKRRVSLRVRAYQSKAVQIYDNNQSYNVSLMFVLKIVDVAKAVFDIEHIETYIDLQSEMVIRSSIASSDMQLLMDDTEHSQQLTNEIRRELLQRFDLAGIELIEVRIMSVPFVQQHNEWKREQILPVLKKLLTMLEKGENSAHSRL